MLLDPFDNAIISIRAFMLAFKSLKSGIFSNFQGNSIFNTKLFQLRYNTIGDIWNTLAQKTIHRSLEDIQVVLNRKVYKVCVQQNSIGWAQGVVMCEEHARWLFWTTLNMNYISFI